MDPTSARELEAASLRAWPAVESEELDGWELRSSGGFSKRANSVQPLGASTRPLPDKVRACETWYDARGLPTIFRFTPFVDAALEPLLQQRGYRFLDPTEVMVLDPCSPETATGVRLAELPIEAWVEAYGALSGLASEDLSGLRAILEACEQPRTLAAVERLPDLHRVGCGLAALDGELLGLFDLVVHPDQRRRGYGAALVRALLRWGLEQGARRAYLQVVRSNAPAVALYRKLGFVHAYSYWYRIRPEHA